MHVSALPRTSLDLHLRFGNIPVDVRPQFWAAAALLGVRYYADPDAGGFGYFLFWIVAAFASVLLQQLAHAAAVRAFGKPTNIVLHGLGGMTAGIDAIELRWRRLVAILVGPLASIGIVALALTLTLLPFPEVARERGWDAPLGTAVAMVVWINYYWALLNLLPLWPLDGGRVTCEIVEGFLGRRGGTLGLGLCILTSGLLGIWFALQMSVHLSDRFDPRYALYLQTDAIHLLFSFLLWLRAFQAIWGDATDAPSTPHKKNTEHIRATR